MSIKAKFSIPLAVLFVIIAVAYIFVTQNHLFGQSIKNGNQKYPLLKDNPVSKSYQLKFITNKYWGNITYSPTTNFFLIDSRIIRKIDSKGVEVFAEKRADEATRLPFTPYLASAKGIIDFSRDKPYLEKFVQIVNGDKDWTLTVDSFTEIYTQAYKDADTVVYDRPNFAEGIDKYRAYMYIDGDWVLFYLSFYALDLDDDYDLGVRVKNYPAKYNRMILLKDISADVYSASDYRLRDREIALNEDKLNYPVMGKLELMGFERGKVSSTFPYTPIPLVYRGQAFYRLTHGDESLFFSETALKQLFKEPRTGMNWYVLPEPYQQQIPIGFLQFKPRSNVDTSGSGGVYVLIRK